MAVGPRELLAGAVDRPLADEAGHLTKLVQQEEYVYEYKYNAKGQRTYCKCYIGRNFK